MLHEAELNGFPLPLPASSEDGVQWEVAKAWEDEVEKAQVDRPSNIRGIEHVADVDAILTGILPWGITNSDILRLQSEETIQKCRDDGETHLDKMLERLGF